MKFFAIALVWLLGVSCSTKADPQEFQRIPVSIDSVETRRVGDNLVRLIRHNMEFQPLVEVEMLSTPEPARIDYLAINRLVVAGETLAFKDADGVYVEDAEIGDGKVTLTFDYFYSGGGSDLVDCELGVEGDKFQALECKKK